jgi:hypothetical protein
MTDGSDIRTFARSEIRGSETGELRANGGESFLLAAQEFIDDPGTQTNADEEPGKLK